MEFIRRCQGSWLAFTALVVGMVVGAAVTAGAAIPGVQVRKAWGPVRAPEGGVFVEIAPRADGGLLAATGNQVSSIDSDGRMALLGGKDRGDRVDRAVLDPAGRAFGLREQGSFQVFDPRDGRRGSLPAPPVSIFKLVPGGALVYAPRVELRREEEWVEAVRFVRPDGTVAAEFPASGLESSRLLPDRIVYSLPDSLEARGLDGGELWRARLQVHKFESARNRTILVPRQVPGQVIHLEKGQRLTEERVEGIVWNLAIAPGSRFSAATTQTILYLFQDGRNAATVRLPVTYANSLDVSDRGEALVGGQGRQGDAQLFLYAADGTLLWRGQAGADRNGWRPAVRFSPGGDRFLVLESQGITAYDIVRSQP